MYTTYTTLYNTVLLNILLNSTKLSYFDNLLQTSQKYNTLQYFTFLTKHYRQTNLYTTKQQSTTLDNTLHMSYHTLQQVYHTLTETLQDFTTVAYISHFFKDFTNMFKRVYKDFTKLSKQTLTVYNMFSKLDKHFTMFLNTLHRFYKTLQISHIVTRLDTTLQKKNL